MANNYLITGYWGEPHVTAENDRGIQAGIIGAGRYVLATGNQFRTEYVGNNTMRVYDGKLLDNGAAAGIPAGEYVDLLIPNTTQGMKRNDLIVFQYSRDASTLVETGVFVLVSGTETTGTPADPVLSQEDLLSGNAFFDQMPLWRIQVEGGSISAPVQLFEVPKNLKQMSQGITVDQTVREGAENPVSGGAVYTALMEKVNSDHEHSAAAITGGTFGGMVLADDVASSGASPCIRNIVYSTSTPSVVNGRIWLKPV